MANIANLHTAAELEELLGRKYFYRQSIYRLAEDGKIRSYLIYGTLFFSREELVLAVLKRLAHRLSYRYPWVNKFRLKVKDTDNKEIVIFGFPQGREIMADTESETEEDLLRKVENFREEVIKMPELPVQPQDHEHEGHEHEHHGPPTPHHGPPHHQEMMEALRRIEDRLVRIEEKIG